MGRKSARIGDSVHCAAALTELVSADNNKTGLTANFLDLLGPVFASFLISKVDMEAPDDCFIGHEKDRPIRPCQKIRGVGLEKGKGE